MIEIPWSVRSVAAGPHQVIVMASTFRLSSAWRSPSFLVASLRLWLRARNADGNLGISLRAAPLAGTFWTLSAWSDRPTLDAFTADPQHRAVMRRFKPHTVTSVFRFWELAPDGLPRTRRDAAELWRDATERLQQPGSG